MIISFKNPIQSDLIIFDETNSSIIKKIIPDNIKSEILFVRKLRIFFTLKILIYFILNSHLLITCTFSNSYSFYNFLRKIKAIYLKCCIDVISPIMIISYIDNSIYLHFISKNSKKKYEVAAVQNGSRLSFNSALNENYHLHHYFCFGFHEIDLMNKNNCEIQNFYPVGSLRASQFINTKKTIFHNEYDILIVSCWRGNIGKEDDFDFTMKEMKKMDILLSRYISKRNLKVGIITRTEKKSTDWEIKEWGTEYDYFYNIYGDKVEIIENNFKDGLVYKKMMTSELSISFSSSALREIYGYGKKILYCNFTGLDKYHGYNSNIELKESSNEAIAKCIDNLLNQSNDEYILSHNENIKYWMNNNNDRCDSIIKNKIIKIISG